jgi:nitrite reductase (NO-forming)
MRDDNPTSASATTPSPAGEAAEFTLETTFDDEGFAFIGVGGDIDGQRNPSLNVDVGALVKVTLRDGEGGQHNISFPDFNATSADVAAVGEEADVTFTVDQEGSFDFFCTFPGHQQAGMQGSLAAGSAGAQEPATAPDISLDPAQVPAPIGAREPQSVRIDLEAKELDGQLAEGATYNYWTFNNTVPGPMLRVRQGDEVELHLKNADDNLNTHSIDLHAVNGPAEAPSAPR